MVRFAHCAHARTGKPRCCLCPGIDATLRYVVRWSVAALLSGDGRGDKKRDAERERGEGARRWVGREGIVWRGTAGSTAWDGMGWFFSGRGRWQERGMKEGGRKEGRKGGPLIARGRSKGSLNELGRWQGVRKSMTDGRIEVRLIRAEEMHCTASLLCFAPPGCGPVKSVFPRARHDTTRHGRRTTTRAPRIGWLEDPMCCVCGCGRAANVRGTHLCIRLHTLHTRGPAKQSKAQQSKSSVYRIPPHAEQKKAMGSAVQRRRQHTGQWEGASGRGGAASGVRCGACVTREEGAGLEVMSANEGGGREMTEGGNSSA